jgi:hypothetical protein
MQFAVALVTIMDLPRSDEHTTIVGRNGSGKTQLGAWLLSMQDFRAKPWVILDYKGDELLNSFEHLNPVDFGDVPDKEGLHILRSRPDLEDETDGFLWKIWDAGNIGVYIDEGYMVPGHRGSAYEALLTQGRSLRTPVITLSQRPVKINRFAFSEASHIVMFHLNDKRDRSVVSELVPDDFMTWIPDEFAPFTRDGKLPPYHSRWYALKKDERYLLRPVPEADRIRNLIAEKLRPPDKPTWRDQLRDFIWPTV